MPHIIKEPYTKEAFQNLRAGDLVLLTGKIYTARDAAHKIMFDLLDKGEPLPFDIKNAIIYYAGPTPAKPGFVIGSVGPTTSYRMDSFTPRFMDEGLIGMIGKGPRGADVKAGISEGKAVYFAAVGGAAALIAKSVKSSKIVAFEELGTEAVRELTVENMPLFVANDMHGGDIYKG